MSRPAATGDAALFRPTREDYAAAMVAWRRRSHSLTDAVLVLVGVGGTLLLWDVGLGQSHPAWLLTFPLGWSFLLGVRALLRRRHASRLDTLGLRCVGCSEPLADPLDRTREAQVLDTGTCPACGLRLFAREA